MADFFTEDALKVLKKGGWKEERKISSDTIAIKLQDEGYPVLTKVVLFLQSFGYLNFTFPNKRTGKIDDFSFNIDRAFELEVPEKISSDYYERIKKKLCSIGTAYREHFILIMDEEGAVYGAYDDYLVKIGSNYYEAINNIIDDATFYEIP